MNEFVPNDVAGQLVKHSRRVGLHCIVRINRRCEGLVLNLDQIQRVFGGRAIQGRDCNDRVTDKPNLVDGKAVGLHIDGDRYE